MSIKEFTENDTERWNNFVLNNAHGTFFHLAEWKTIFEESFRLKTFYFYAEECGEIVGVLPLALVKRPVFGAVLISSPLCVYGGALGKVEELENAAQKKAEELGIQYLELRNQNQTSNNFQTTDRFYTFQKELSENHEENLTSIPRKQRAEVRKGIAINLETTVNQNIELFYKLYSTSVRNLGTPVFPKKYLKNLIETFGKNCEITTVSYQGKPLTSVLSFRYKDQILPYYGGGLPEARNYSAYPYMYWKVMENAVENGARVFDFGRSMKGTGAYSFKKNFGFEPNQLHYQYHLVKAGEVPDMDPDSARNKMITNAWSKLPLPLANKLGPYLYPVIM